MKKKIIIIFICVIILCALLVGFLLINNKNSDIPKGYICVFHGGSGEVLNETYIYKIDNGHSNSGFKYISVVRSTVSYGSSESKVKIVKKGKFDWTDGAFTVAEENNAYSYVTLPNSKKTYSIEEYRRMFIMN